MRKHIMLIDDDEDELDFFLAVEKKMPGAFTCTYLSDGREAVNSIKKMKPDLVFLDMNMPGMNGLECMAEIKKEGADKNTKVVFYSTGMDSAACKKAIAMGAIDCLKKPIDLASFQKLLRDMLSRL